MTGNALSTLLNEFHLLNNRTVKNKKRRFREFIGLVIDT